MKTIPLLALLLALAAATAASAVAAAPAPRAPGGFAVGKVTAVNGSRFVVQGRTSPVGVILTKTTSISETTSLDATAIAKGACISAFGTKGKQGKLRAAGVTVASEQGGCTAGPRRNGRRPGGAAGRRPPGNRGANGPRAPQRPAGLDVAFGKVTSVDGTTLTVEAQTGSTTTVVLSKDTRITKRGSASSKAIAVGKCATVRGQASASGSVVTALSVELSLAGKNGCAFGGFGGFGGFRGGRPAAA